MSKNGDYVTAYFLGKKINVINGYKSPVQGFMVEIFSDSVPRQSISVWRLNHKNAPSAENLFQKIFGIPYGAAKKYDKEKGVETKTTFLVETNKRTSELSEILIPKGERVPEDVILFAMAMSINHGTA